VPTDQDKKLAAIHQMAGTLAPALNPQKPSTTPTDQQNVEALQSTAGALTQFATSMPGPGADAAKRLSGPLSQLAKADAGARQRATAAFVAPLQVALFGLKAALDPQPVSVATLPPELKRQWVAADGQARVQVLPKGDPENTAVLRQLDAAVLAIEPDATG